MKNQEYKSVSIFGEHNLIWTIARQSVARFKSFLDQEFKSRGAPTKNFCNIFHEYRSERKPFSKPKQFKSCFTSWVSLKIPFVCSKVLLF